MKKPRKDAEDTLPQTTHTLLDDPSLWLSESAPLSQREKRNLISWRILYVFVYGTLLITAGLVSSVWWPEAVPSAALFMFKALMVHTLCFICGINWGVALRYAAVSQQMPAFVFLWAPLPAYLAWPCLLLPTPWYLIAMAILYGWSYWVERDMWLSSGLAPWLKTRNTFTIFMILICLVGTLGAHLNNID